MVCRFFVQLYIDMNNEVLREEHVSVLCNSVNEGIDKIKQCYKDYDIANIQPEGI